MDQHKHFVEVEQPDLTIFGFLSFIICSTVFGMVVLFANFDAILERGWNTRTLLHSPESESPPVEQHNALYNFLNDLLCFILVLGASIFFIVLIYLLIMKGEEDHRRYLNEMDKSRQKCGEYAYWSKEKGECIDFLNYEFKYRLR